MKRVILLCPLYLSLLNPVISQDYKIDWRNCYGGSLADHANDIVQTTGGYLVVGTTKSDDGDVSFNHGTEDVWLIKIDSSEPCYGKKPMVVQAVMVQSEYLRRPVFILYCWRFVVI